ncbi:hypothetical protein EZS27_035776, partial [termite gut metagenome]
AIEGISILFEGAARVYTEEYEQAISFNQRIKSKCICVEFIDCLKTSIHF